MGKSDLNHETILAVAAELFRETDYVELTIEDVARAARLSKGTVYRHFKGKRELLMGVIGRHHKDLCAALSDIIFGEGDALEKLRRICECLVASYQRRGKLNTFQYELFFQGMGQDIRQHSEMFREYYGELRNLIARLMDQGIASGDFRSDISADALSYTFLDLMMGWGNRQSSTVPDSDKINRTLTIFTHGVVAK